MTSPRMGRPGLKLPAAEVVCLAFLLVLMVFSWFLGHGLTRGMYDQFAQLGDPPAAMGPVGQTGRSQLGHWGYFWSERAFHYRTTLMFAVDDYASPEVLSRDTAQQFPEGVDAWREYTLLMEPVYGTLYRWFGQSGEILAEFLTRLIPLIHVLLFLPIYLAARGFGVRPVLALAAVVIYATCALGYSRFTGSLLLKEDFALLWLLFFLAAHVLAERRRSPALLVAAAVSLLILLASWHLSQFLALVVLGSLALAASLERQESGAWPVVAPGAYLLACTLAGLTPSLLARGFFLSLTMMLMVSWVAVALLRGRVPALGDKPRSGFLLLAGLFLVLGAASFLNRQLTGDYNHLFGLLVQKLAHGFQRPDDPRLLPFDVRVFWASPFNSPGWPQIGAKLGYHLLLLVPAITGAVVLLVTGRSGAGRRALLVMTLAFTLGWLFVERLGVVFLPFAVMTAAVVAEAAGAWFEEKRGWLPGGSRQLTVIALALMLVTPAGNLAGGMADQVRTALDVSRGRPVFIGSSDKVFWGFRTDLMRWLVANTPGPFSRYGPGQAASVLGDIGLSPQVLLYTGHPVVLNSQFENQPVRERYRRYLEALYSSDPGLLREFLAETKSAYLFIDRNLATGSGPGTGAYQAGLNGPPGLDWNIARLHFRPESLDFLQPVYNSEYYRLFRVGPRPAKGQVTWDRNYGNWWNLERYTVEGGKLTDLTGDRRRLQDFEDALVFLQEAQGQLMASLAASTPPGQPSLPELHQRYMEMKLLLAGGDSAQAVPPDAERQLDQLIDLIQGRLGFRDPVSGRPLGQALAALFTSGPGQGRPGWRQLLQQDLAEPAHLAAAGQLAALLGQYRQAADLLVQAAGFFPLTPTVAGDGRPGPQDAPLARQVRQTAVWYCLAADRVNQARELAEAFAPLVAPGSATGKFYGRVQAIPEK